MNQVKKSSSNRRQNNSQTVGGARDNLRSKSPVKGNHVQATVSSTPLRTRQTRQSNVTSSSNKECQSSDNNSSESRRVRKPPPSKLVSPDNTFSTSSSRSRKSNDSGNRSSSSPNRATRFGGRKHMSYDELESDVTEDSSQDIDYKEKQEKKDEVYTVIGKTGKPFIVGPRDKSGRFVPGPRKSLVDSESVKVSIRKEKLEGKKIKTNGCDSSVRRSPRSSPVKGERSSNKAISVSPKIISFCETNTTETVICRRKK